METKKQANQDIKRLHSRSGNFHCKPNILDKDNILIFSLLRFIFCRITYQLTYYLTITYPKLA